MTTDWLQTTPTGSLTCAQVLEAGLPAWDGAGSEGQAPYHFDGQSFVRRSPEGERRLAASEVPEIGWHHQRDCRCLFCRPGAA